MATELPYKSWYDLEAYPRIKPAEGHNGRLASAVINNAEEIARWQWHNRFKSVVFSRYATGRDTVNGSYNYSIVKRPISVANDFYSSEWRPPSLNQIATAMDVYSTRIFKNRPFIQILPLAGAGGFKARTRSKRLSRYIDATFDACKFWETTYLLGRDCMEQGTAVVKIHEDQHKKGAIAISRVLKDEILISDEEAIYGPVPSLTQVVFYNRRDLMARYGKTKELREIIAKAPAVYAGFCGALDTSYKNIVPVYESWSKPFGEGKEKLPGRHCIVFSGHVLLDEERTENYFPFEYLKFAPLTNSPWGQGLVEQTLGSQVSLDDIETAIDEAVGRVMRPIIFVEEGSNVSHEQLVGVPGTVCTYTGTKPTQETPPVMPPEAYQLRDTRKQEVLQRAGISQNATSGVTPEGLTAAVAIMANSNIEDSRHADLAERFEDFVTAVGLQVLALATKLKPQVKTPGRRGTMIDFDDVALTYDPDNLVSSEFNAEAFPLSRFPTTIAAREQQISDWLANGQVSRKDAMRAGLLPDTEALGDESTVEPDLIDEMLDTIVETSEFSPPPAPFVDAQMALDMTRKRWAKELQYGDTPPASFRALFQFMEALKDFIKAAPAPANTNAAPGAAPPASQPVQAAA
jgi:hypothetical protein